MTSIGAPTALCALSLFVLSSTLTAQADSVRRDTAQTLRAVEIRGSITGVGQARTGNAVSRVDIQLAPSGTSALKVAEKLPGVNFQTADPFGLYEWANRVTIRGFGPGQIGQTFDGIPLGDMSYGNFNGLGVGRAVDADNLSDATVTQGTGALGTASSNNLGGAIQYLSADPSNQRSLTVRQMVGQASARRTSGRWDTGLLQTGGNLAFKGFISLSRYDTDKWKGSGERFSPAKQGIFGQDGLFGGAGEQWQDQVNVKLQAIAGAHRLTFFYDFADKKEADYTDLTLRRFNELGRDHDQFSDWNAAKAQAASDEPDRAYFHSAQGSRRDHLAYIAGELQLADNARLEVRPYFHNNEGAGDWHAPSYGSAFSPDPIYFRQTQYENERFGIATRTRVTLGANDLEIGGWLEHNESNIRRVAWRLVDFDAGPSVNFADVLRLFFDRTGEFLTRTIYVQNTNTVLSDRLRLTYGAKYLYIDADFKNNGKSIGHAASAPDVNRPDASIPTDGGILPQVGAVWSLSTRDQLFANYSQNVNAFPYSPQSGVYNVDPTQFDRFEDTTDPEKAHTYELGVRTRRERVEASLAVYAIDYRNRLIGVSVCPLTATCVSSFANVGSVSTRGAEALVALRVAEGLSLVTTGSVNDSKIDDDYRTDTSLVRSAGKTVIDAPKVMVNTTLKLDRRAWFGSLGARHVGKRYFSILNDISTPSFTVADLTAGYRFPGIGAMKDLTLQLNAMNLFDEEYVSTMGTGGFSLRGDRETLMAGQKRLLFVSVSTRF